MYIFPPLTARSSPTEEEMVNNVLNADGTPKCGVGTGVSRIRLNQLVAERPSVGETVVIPYRQLGAYELYEGHIVWIRKCPMGIAYGLRHLRATLFGKSHDDLDTFNRGRLRILWIPTDPTANGGFLGY